MWPIVGHEWAIDLLVRSIETRKLGHAYLFVGPGQVGKRTLAKAFAQAILCADADVPCGVCRSCQLVHRERHPDLHVIDPEGDRIKIGAIRTMLRSVPLSPVEGSYRICIISRFRCRWISSFSVVPARASCWRSLVRLPSASAIRDSS